MKYNEISSGEVYFIDGEKMLTDGLTDSRDLPRVVWGKRPGVVVSSDRVNKTSDRVIVAFLTRRAHAVRFYDEFSPQQVDVELNGETSTVLCSHAKWVWKEDLGRLMGAISPTELKNVAQSVRQSNFMERDGTDSLYRPEEWEVCL